MKKIELLSPAGNFESFKAAVAAGADAVYLGGTNFGARAFSNNFDKQQMKEALSYAHTYGVKVYVTVNTLIYDDEIDSLIKYITFLYEIGIDALIIQDLGVLSLIRSMFPDFEIHASTQMHIHNIESLNVLQNLGVKRVVLPRELSLNEIIELKEKTNLEIEVFIQGSLCISYSGQCLMSYLIGGRSGNRGECAGSCRLPYQLIEEINGKKEVIDVSGDYLLSTKDLFSLDHIKELIEIGIDSLKIEGRMKSPEYIFLVTSLYRKAINQYYKNEKYIINEEDITNLKKLFNRGFTSGYLFNDSKIMNNKRPNHMGIEIGNIIKIDGDDITIRLNSNLNCGDGIRILSDNDIGFTVTDIIKNGILIKEAFSGDVITLKSKEPVKIESTVLKTTDIKLLKIIKHEYEETQRKVPITGIFTASLNDVCHLTISDGVNEITIDGNIKISKALSIPVTKDIILEKLNKIGDTPYIFSKIDVLVEDNIFIPLTEINNIKRQAVDALITKRLFVKRKSPEEYNLIAQDKKQEQIMIKAKVKNMDQYKACIDSNIDMIYVDNEELYEQVKDNKKVYYAVPRVRKRSYNKKHMLISDIGMIENNSIADYSLNVTNSYSVALLHSLGASCVTLSYELDKDRVKNLMKDYINRYKVNPNLEITIYGRVEAMISKYCPLKEYLKSGNTCNICKNKKKYYLGDRFKNDYPLTFNNCLMTIYDYKIMNNINETEDYIKMGVRNFRFNFVDEDYDECIKIINSIKKEIL